MANKNKKLKCHFCWFELKEAESNNGLLIAKILKKKTLKICKICNLLEIYLRCEMKPNEAFKVWIDVESKLEPMRVQKIKQKGYDKAFRSD